MTIEVIGKAHLRGTSRKTGKPYDFVQLHFTSPARGVDGLSANTLSLDSSLIDYEDILVGDNYDLEFDMRGYCVGIKPAF